MTLPRLVAAFAAFAFASAAVAGDPPKVDAYGLPLPTGAKTRLGNTTLVFRYAPSFAPLPPDYKFIGIADSGDVLRRVEIGSTKPPERPTGFPGGGGQLIVSGDGKHYIVFRTGIVTIRSAATGKPETQIKRTEGFSTTFVSGQASAALSADGKVFVQGGQDKEGKGDVTVWDVEKNEVLFHTGIAGRGAALPVLSADGKLLATRGVGGFTGPPLAKGEDDPRHIIQVWDIAEKKELFQAKVTAGGGHQITATAFSPDGSLLAASMGDGLIDWWDVKTGKPRTPLLGRSGQGYRVAFSPDGKTLATASADNTVKMWDTATWQNTATLKGHTDYVSSVAFSPDGKSLATGSYDHTAKVWDLETAKVRHTLEGHKGAVLTVAFHPNGKELATAGIDGAIKVWNVATGGPSFALEGHKSWVNAIAYSPDGGSLASASSDNTVGVWNRTTRKLVEPITPKAAEVRSLAFSPDGKLLAAGTRYGVTKVWNGNGDEVASLKGKGGDVWGVAFSPDGKTLATADGDWNKPSDGVLWDTKTWKERARLKHTNEVLCVAFHPTKSILAAGAWDKTVRVWDLTELLKAEK